MATGLKSKTFTIENQQGTGSGSFNTNVYTCPASKYAEVLIAYASFSGGGSMNIGVDRAIASGFSNIENMLSQAAGVFQAHESISTIYTSTTGGSTIAVAKLRIYPGDRVNVQSSSGSFEYRIAIEEVSAY
jgi:hypothetical protein